MHITVASATPSEWAAACRVLSTCHPSPDRNRAVLHFLNLLTSGQFDPAGLFIAREESGRICGAMLVQELPGALGVVWPPQVEPPSDPAADALVSATCNWLRSRGVKVCQLFTPAGDQSGMRPLLRYGFEHVTQLKHMRRPVEPDRDTHSFDPASSALTFHLASGPLLQTFEQTLLATYRGSLDCPELNGTRSVREILDGHRSPRTARPEEMWLLARHQGQPVGVILFDTVDEGTLELSYVGLVPEARGRGFAGELVRFAIQSAVGSGNRAVNVSVDTRNLPAVRLYQRHGFREYDCREVYLASWPGKQATM